MPRASTPRSARQARTAADPLLRKPQVIIQTVPKKTVVAQPAPTRKSSKPIESASASKKWVASPVTEAPSPDKDTPWRHPAELEYITPPLKDDEIIEILVKNGFSVPPRARASKDPWTKITSWDGQTVTTIPRLYRLPLMFAAKFQWQSLKLIMASENREKEWEEYKYDILHVSRLCVRFLEEARKAQSQMLLNKEWKCHTFDRAIIRYYQKWLLSRDEFVKEFWYEFDEDEYRKNVFELNWHKFVLEGHKGFNLTKEEVINGLNFEGFTEGCGFVDGRVKWGAPSNSASTTTQHDDVLGSSSLPTSSNGLSADPIGRLRPRVDKLSLEVKHEMLDDSLSISSTSSSLSPAPSSALNSPVERQPRYASETRDHNYGRGIRVLAMSGTNSRDALSLSPAQVAAELQDSMTPVTSPSTLTAVTHTHSHGTNTDLSSVPSASQSINGTPGPERDADKGCHSTSTPPPSAPSDRPDLLGNEPSPTQATPKASTAPPTRASPLPLQITTNGTSEAIASSPPSGGSAKTPSRNSWDARVRAKLATTKSTDTVPMSVNASPGDPTSTTTIPARSLSPSLRRRSPVVMTPPTLNSEVPARQTDSDLPPEYNEKELLQTYFQIPDSILGTPTLHEAPKSADLAPPAIADVIVVSQAAGAGFANAKESGVQRGDEVAGEPFGIVSTKALPLDKAVSPSSFDISSSRESSADRPTSPNMDVSPPDQDGSNHRPRSSSDSMDVDNPFAEKVTTVLKHTVQGLTELMNSVHSRSSVRAFGSDVDPMISSPQLPSPLSGEPSLADLMIEIRSLKNALREESKQKADRDVEMRQLKAEIEDLRRMLARSPDDGMSVDSDFAGTRASHSASFYSPYTAPISAHPLYHLVHADDEEQLSSRHHRSVSGSSTFGLGESASMASKNPSPLIIPTSSTKPVQSPVPENVPLKLKKKKNMVYPKPSE